MKTIDEKAKAYAGMNEPHPQDLFTMAVINGLHDGFKAGAEWMLGKVMDLLEDCEVFDRLGGRPIKAEDFRKALEE